jgi:hypothetical protein
VTLLSQKEREEAKSVNTFRDRLYQTEGRDREQLRKMGAADSFSARVGISGVTQHVFQWCWTFLSANEVPKLSRTMHGMEKKNGGSSSTIHLSLVSIDKLKALTATLDETESTLSNLSTRKLASDFTVQFIQVCFHHCFKRPLSLFFCRIIHFRSAKVSLMAMLKATQSFWERL